MSLHIHRLDGCAPMPLAHYLKALGILRLVSEQKDRSVRGWWQDETFFLASILDRRELLDFFLYEYAPTPIVAPWNALSGFYSDKGKTLTELEQSKAKRFIDLRIAINKARNNECNQFEEILKVAQEAKSKANKNKNDKKLAEIAKKADDDRKNLKEIILAECLRTWRGSQGYWLRSAASEQGAEEKSKITYSAIMGGAGGVNAKLEFTSNFMQSLGSLFSLIDGKPKRFSEQFVENSLFNEIVADTKHIGKGNSGGQFFPYSVKAANGSTGFSSDRWINPWDFILTLEGVLIFQSSVVKKIGNQSGRLTVSPFCVVGNNAGSESSGTGKEKVACEQWFPLWEHPVSTPEFQQLIAEGRSSRQRNVYAESGIDMARSISRLGVARGITSFERYSYIQRNGNAHFATPLGRWRVSRQPYQNLIDQIAPWVEKIRRAANDKKAPASFGRAVRTCEEAILNCCRNGNLPRRWQELLIALGMAEQTLLRSPGFTAAAKYLHPLPGLEPGWLKAMRDESPELRLAVAFAAQYGCDENGKILWYDPLRRHLLPLKSDKQGRVFQPYRFQSDKTGLHHDTNVIFHGRDFLSDSCAILKRRIIFRTGDGLPLTGLYATAASLSDIALFLGGKVDICRLAALSWPLTAVRWYEKDLPKTDQASRPRHIRDSSGLLDLFGLLRLTHLPVGSLKLSEGDITVRCDPAILQNLVTGGAGRAMNIACRRLRSSGLRPYLQTAMADRSQALRLAASLVFPLRRDDIRVLCNRLTKPTIKPEQEHF